MRLVPIKVFFITGNHNLFYDTLLTMVPIHTLRVIQFNQVNKFVKHVSHKSSSCSNYDIVSPALITDDIHSLRYHLWVENKWYLQSFWIHIGEKLPSPNTYDKRILTYSPEQMEILRKRLKMYL